MKKWQKLFLACAAVLAMGGAALPAPAAAFNLGGVIGSVKQGYDSYKEVDKVCDYLDDTEEGRHTILNSWIESMGVVEGSPHQGQLDRLMDRMQEGIATVDPSILEKPYIYWITPDPSFNAACGMGHIMYVHEGLWSYLTNEDEIAVVLGHEMGHGQRKHVANAIRKQAKVQIGKSALANAMGNTSAITSAVINIAVNQLNTVVITKGDEWDADNMSFDYVYAAGYNPGATAALWQRMMDAGDGGGTNFAKEIFSPSDHPTHKQRRDNYEKKLTALSGKKVTIQKDSDMVQVNGKDFVLPAPVAGMSSAERKYFVMGNLAAAYDKGQAKQAATAQGGTVYLGAQAIMTPVDGDPSAEELAARLNEIK